MSQHTTTTRTRTRERTHAPACTADQCRQGRTACPCPQACELPATGDPLQDTPATRTSTALFAAVVLAVVVCFVVIMAASA